MALQSVTGFASFDQATNTYQQDLSEVLVEAAYFDLNFFELVPMGWDSPVDDTVNIWNVDNLNTDTVTLSVSAAGGGTTLNLNTGQGGRVPVNGMLLQPRLSGNREIIQVTDGAGTLALTVTRGFGSTPTASLAAGTTLVVMDALQEASDIGSDASLNPTPYTNYTHIAGARDLIVTGSQLARRQHISALQDWVGHQLANRALELRRKWIYIFLHSELAGTPQGSDAVYRTLKGVRSWIRSYGVTEDTAETLGLTRINSVNKSLVDLGEYADSLLVGTDLVNSIAAIDASSRRLYESDTSVGYTVQEVVTNLGNPLRVAIDNRVQVGEAHIFSKRRVKPRPYQGRGMFSIAATDFSDARKRRILSEWTLNIDDPTLLAHLTSKA